MQQGMFNYASILNEISGQNQQGLGSFQMGDATLFIFTPKVIATQVLRSYHFNFSNEMVNELSHYRNVQEAISPMGGGNKTAINQAILPEMGGKISNCMDMNTKYTFLLVIDNDPYKYRGLRNCAPSHGNRLIGIGFFTDEPISPFGNAPNPNAVMVFTHYTSTFNMNNYGQMGAQNVTSIAHDVDVVASSTKNMYQDQLFLGTPGDIMKTVQMTSMGDCIGDIGSIMVQPAQGEAPSPMVQNVLKSPRHFLNNIAEGIDTAVAEIEDGRSNTLRSAIMPNNSIDELSSARTYFAENVQSSSTTMPSNGFNMNRPCTMQELLFQYPNIVIKPFKVPEFSSWSTSPQEAMTLRNMASSMIAGSLQSFAHGCGLLSIAFYYDSSWKESPFSTKRPGMWNVMESGTIYPTTEEQKLKHVKDFQKALEYSLFPILKSLNGEFTLGVLYNSGGDILIDLIYLDQTQGFTQGEGYYETNSRLGGMLNPVLMDYQGLMDNSGQVCSLVDTMFGKKLGPDIFHQGTERFVSNAIESGQAMDYGSIVDTPVSNPVPVGMANNNMYNDIF